MNYPEFDYHQSFINFQDPFKRPTSRDTTSPLISSNTRRNFLLHFQILDEDLNSLLNFVQHPTKPSLTHSAFAKAVSDFHQFCLMNINTISKSAYPYFLKFSVKSQFIFKITSVVKKLLEESNGMNSGELLTLLYNKITFCYSKEDLYHQHLLRILWSIFAPTLDPLLKFIDSWLGLSPYTHFDLNPYDEFFLTNIGELDVILILLMNRKL